MKNPPYTQNYRQNYQQPFSEQNDFTKYKKTPPASLNQPLKHSVEDKQFFNQDTTEDPLQSCYDDVRSHLNDLSMQIENEHEVSRHYSTDKFPERQSSARCEPSEKSVWHPQLQFNPLDSVQRQYSQPGNGQPTYASQDPQNFYSQQMQFNQPNFQFNQTQTLATKQPAPQNYAQKKSPVLMEFNMQSMGGGPQFEDNAASPQEPAYQQRYPPQGRRPEETSKPQSRPMPEKSWDMHEDINSMQNYDQKPDFSRDNQKVNKVLEFNFRDVGADKPIENFDEVPIKPSANNSYYNQPEEEEERQFSAQKEKMRYDDMPVASSQKRQKKQSPNPYDERPVGGAKTQGVEDIPIKSKVNNFQELLEKELKKNPDAALALDEVPPPSVPRKKDFLRRKKPVTAPPKNSKPTKYKYYAENFTDDPFYVPDAEPKLASKQQKQAPFSNVAERKAAHDTEEQKKVVKPKPKKNFLVRGGGTGGGVGQPGQQKDKEVEKETKKDKLKDKEKEKERDKSRSKETQPLKSNRTHQRNKSSVKPPQQRPKTSKHTKKKIFASDSEDDEESNSDYKSDHRSSSKKKPRYTEDSNIKSDHSGSAKASDDEQNDVAAQPPLTTEEDLNDEELEITRTNIPEHLLENLPPRVRENIENKMYRLDTEIAKHERVHKQYIDNKKQLQKQLEDLRNHNEEFEQTSQKEIQELKDYQEEQLKQIRKERKEFEKSQKDKKGSGGNKGKQEIDELKQRMDELRAEIRVKDKKSNSTIEKLKAELDFYNTQNDEIQAEIRKIEKDRINMMHQQKEADQLKRKPAPVESQPKKKVVIAHFDQFDENNNDEVIPEEGEDDDEPEDDVEEGSEDEEYLMTFPHKYHNESAENSRPVRESIGNNGKIQREFVNGKREIIFSNGVKKLIFPDGYTVVYFINKDIKQTFPDGKSVYYFSEAETTQTTYPNNLKVFRFGNGQIEKHYPDNTKEICFTDGTVKCIFADGEEESVFPDGMIQRIDRNGVKTIEMPDGRVQTFRP